MSIMVDSCCRCDRFCFLFLFWLSFNRKKKKKPVRRQLWSPGARFSVNPDNFSSTKSYFMSARFTLKVQILFVFKVEQ